MYGCLFRQLRKDRGLTLQEVATQTISSVSFISKFEKEQSDISVSRLVHLLDAINVTVEEFLYLYHQQAEKPIFKHLTALPSYISSSFFENLNCISKINEETIVSRDFTLGIQKLDALEHKLDKSTKAQEYTRIYLDIIREALRFNQRWTAENGDIETKKIALQLIQEFREKTGPIIHYLHSVDNWGLFEITLFRYFQFTFPPDDVSHLLPIAVTRTKKQQGLAMMDQLKLDLVFSSFSVFINFDDFIRAKNSLDLAEKLLREENDFFNSTKLKFYQGWYLLAQKDFLNGQLLCEQAISICHILKQKKAEENYRRMLTTLLKMIDETNSVFFFT
ncbi:hypothetical protein CBF34_00715 [Vagococcus penaei]|uniref:Uncharacterized protein n=1 Tax=Vagococcus penaei TaxID=633807 RepID=A0A1Q2D5T5_9ENTE|nr:Rgg/GadR/MutR family transcriptional regulator [Vagococcus penaei]AQP53617.1 hypothetical protein BW732_04795 [Vagococcus penaei]RSU07562.1 hypothetical protein CBF34_00715 [Vagococcus penaei]